MENGPKSSISFESSSTAEGSGSKKTKETKESKSSKKKSGAESLAASRERPPISKKEEVADRAKELFGRFLGDDKAEKPTKGEKGEKSDASEESNPAETAEVTPEHPAEIAEKDVETLTPEEDADITRQLAEQKIVELQAETTGTEDPAEVVARQAVIAKLEEIRESGEIEPAAAEDIEALETDTEEETKPLRPEPADNTPEVSDEPAEFDDDEPIRLNGATQASGSAAGGKSGGGTPPPPPISPAGGATPPPGARPPLSPQPGFNPNQPGGPFNPNVNVAPAAANTAGYQPDYRTNPNATYLLAGGIVGYLIGRRRGRIKTEKRMKVVQQKLEKQVEAKQQEINRTTETLRRQVRENYEARTEQLSKPDAAETARVSETAPAEKSARRAERLDGLVPLPMPVRPSAAPETRAAVTAAENVRVERAEVERHIENRAERIKTVELEDKEILRISETITVGATNLRKVYEAKLVTRSGLRRLVNEHMQGKDIRRGLAREFLAKELSYERDPRFRDALSEEGLAAKRGGASAQSTDAQAVGAPAVELATASAPSTETQQSLESSRKSRPPRNAVSTGLITALTIIAMALVAYAVLLGLSR